MVGVSGVCDVVCDVDECGVSDGVVKWEVPQVGGGEAGEAGRRRQGGWVVCECRWGRCR